VIRVLVVGQTPPPHHGQAIAIERLLTGQFIGVRLYHVRMRFSTTIDDVGKPGIRKILRLVLLVARIVAARVRYRTSVLYYPPSGPKRVPMYRDAAVLIATRWLFRRTVFHFHAGGLTDMLRGMAWPERALFRLAYSRPDMVIRIAEETPRDGEMLGARQERIIPYGIEDVFPGYESLRGGARPTPVILFVGMLSEGKGVLTLLDACARLRARGVPFSLRLVGGFASAQIEAGVRGILAKEALEDAVAILGVTTGDAKWREFAGADIFCFPTFHESETFGLAVLEAMQFRLPVVATRWRGVQSLVRDGETGFLVEPRDSRALADRLDRCLADPELRRRMGERARELFCADYTLDQWRRRMEEALLAAAAE
jgi:glycosyltransferase involved in cell wall biosynthesis